MKPKNLLIIILFFICLLVIFLLYNKVESFQNIQFYDDYTIIFLNKGANGDIYLVSQFVIDIKNKVKNTCKYYFSNKSVKPENFDFLNIDVSHLNDGDNTIYPNKLITINDEKKEIIINTHTNAYSSHHRFELDDVNIVSFRNAFREVYNFLNIQMEDLEYYIPSFNQPSFTIYNDNLNTIKDIYNKIPKRKILICNGAANWRKIPNIDPLIIKFFLDNNFYVKVTNKESINDPKILGEYNKNIDEYSNSAEYINLIKNDNLLYINNIIASQSEYVLGLPSGLFITTFSKETLDTKFIILSPFNLLAVHENFNYTWINITEKNTDAILKEIEPIIN